MNHGLLGFPTLTRPAIETTVVALARKVYVVATEPVSDTAVLGNDGNPLELRFFLQAARTVQVRFIGVVIKGVVSHYLRCSLYDNGVKVAPSTSLSSNGWHSWIDTLLTASQPLQFDAILSLAAGWHVIDMRRNAVTGTSSSTFGTRALVAEILAP